MSNSELGAVFVTGSSGFVGKNLVRALAQSGRQVRCLVRKSSARAELSIPGVTLIEGDLFDHDALLSGISGASVVYHLAGLTRAPSLKVFLDVNRDGSRNVIQAVEKAAEQTGMVPRTVFVSSLAAAGPAPRLIPEEVQADGTKRKFRPKRETDFTNPVSSYGISKLEGEREFLAFADRLPITVVRPGIVFGPGDMLGLPLFKMAHQGVFWIPGWKDREFSYIFVKELVSLIIKLGEKGKTLTGASLPPVDSSGKSKGKEGGTGEGIYFISHPDRPRFSVFGRMLGEATGRKRTRTPYCPPVAVLIGGLLMECIRKITGWTVSLDWNKSREALSGPWICDGTKAEKDAEYEFQTPLKNQFIETAQWYFENGYLK